MVFLRIARESEDTLDGSFVSAWWHYQNRKAIIGSQTHIILLSGGSGSRLWPLSNESRSKQFLKVLRNSSNIPESMVQRTFRKIKEALPEANLLVATGNSQVYSIESQIEGDYDLVVEPERRDTAPAIMLSCAKLAFDLGADPNDSVIVLPIDTYADDGYYKSLARLAEAVDERPDGLVLLGIEPTYPSEKYGYIVPVDTVGDIYEVSCFAEKPSEAKAQSLIEKGALWNGGIFGFKLGYGLDILRRYTSSKDLEEIIENYSEFPKVSFDYEVVEKADSIAVVPCQGEWKDLGTWNTLSEEMAEAYSGRIVFDADTCENLHAINETNIPLVVSGVSNAVVVATPDGILVSSKEHSAKLKLLVEQAAYTRPMYEKRRWGEYRVIDSGVYKDNQKAMTKELVIQPGKQLTYQRHFRRAEVWTVVSGEGEIVLNGDVQPLTPGRVVNIQAEQLHSARAFTELHVIEVQLGDVLVEEDIERFGNYWK